MGVLSDLNGAEDAMLKALSDYFHADRPTLIKNRSRSLRKYEKCGDGSVVRKKEKRGDLVFYSSRNPERLEALNESVWVLHALRRPVPSAVGPGWDGSITAHHSNKGGRHGNSVVGRHIQ